MLMTGEIPGLFAKDEMMAMTADLRNSFLKVGRARFQACAVCAFPKGSLFTLKLLPKKSFVEWGNGKVPLPSRTSAVGYICRSTLGLGQLARIRS